MITWDGASPLWAKWLKPRNLSRSVTRHPNAYDVLIGGSPAGIRLRSDLGIREAHSGSYAQLPACSCSEIVFSPTPRQLACVFILVDLWSVASFIFPRPLQRTIPSRPTPEFLPSCGFLRATATFSEVDRTPRSGSPQSALANTRPGRRLWLSPGKRYLFGRTSQDGGGTHLIRIRFAQPAF